MSLQNARGVQPLSLTTVQRDAMSAAQKTEGLIVLDTDLEELLYWDGAEWMPLGGGGSEVFVGDTPPDEPEQGNLWWDTEDGRLYIYYNDGNTQQWVEASPAGGGGGEVEEAPVDGQQYARQNAAWSVVQGGSGNTTINYNVCPS